MKVPINESYPLLDYDSKFGVVDDNFYLGDMTERKGRNRDVLKNGTDNVRVVGLRPTNNLSSHTLPKTRLGTFDISVSNNTDHKPPRGIYHK